MNIPLRGSSCPLFPGWIGIWNVGFWGRRNTKGPREKPSEQDPLIEPRPQWWKASTLATALSLLPYILTFSIKLMVISTGTIFPSLMQESIRSPFSEPLFLSSLNKSPADKWMYPNFWKINNTQNEFFPKQYSDFGSVSERWNKKSSSMRKKSWLGMVSPILVTDWSLLPFDSFVAEQVYVGGYVRRRIFTTKENTR